MAETEVVPETLPETEVPTPTVPPEHPEPDYASQKLAEIREQQRRVDAAAAEMDEAANKHKAAKANYEAEDARLQSLCREGPTLFEVKDDGAVAADGEWRTVRLDTLDIPPGTLKRLAEAEIETLGALADYPRPMDLVPGIGPAAQEKIEAAVDAYYKAHPVATEAAPASETPEPEAPTAPDA